MLHYFHMAMHLHIRPHQYRIDFPSIRWYICSRSRMMIAENREVDRGDYREMYIDRQTNTGLFEQVPPLKQR
jgi:hypothetical protein